MCTRSEPSRHRVFPHACVRVLHWLRGFGVRSRAAAPPHGVGNESRTRVGVRIGFDCDLTVIGNQREMVPERDMRLMCRALCASPDRHGHTHSAQNARSPPLRHKTLSQERSSGEKEKRCAGQGWARPLTRPCRGVRSRPSDNTCGDRHACLFAKA